MKLHQVVRSAKAATSFIYFLAFRRGTRLTAAREHAAQLVSCPGAAAAAQHPLPCQFFSCQSQCRPGRLLPWLLQICSEAGLLQSGSSLPCWRWSPAARKFPPRHCSFLCHSRSSAQTQCLGSLIARASLPRRCCLGMEQARKKLQPPALAAVGFAPAGPRAPYPGARPPSLAAAFPQDGRATARSPPAPSRACPPEFRCPRPLGCSPAPPGPTPAARRSGRWSPRWRLPADACAAAEGAAAPQSPQAQA